MYRMIYLSSASVPIDDVELSRILAVSRRNNTRDGVSGLLTHHEGNFLQILEGPQDAVLSCYTRIQGDPRHFQVIVVASGPVESRLFGEWSMALADPARLDGAGTGDPEDGSVRAFSRLQAQVDEIGAVDRRAGIMLRTFLGSFREFEMRSRA